MVTLDTQCNPATEYVKLRGLGEDKKYRVEVVGMQTGGENGQRINGTPNAVEPEYYTGHSLCMQGCRFRGLGTSISRGRCTLRKCKENIWKVDGRCCEGKLSEAGACFVPMSENKKS